MSIKAPFNFIPLSDQVVFPHWADYISHDIPFEGEESGELVVEITARSPIAVLSAKSPEWTESNKVRETMRFKDQAFIPGSSIKGMIRSALEVMTFSKIGNKVQDDKYAVRDLHNKDKNLYMNHFSPNSIRCGWLHKTGEGYQITDCGLPGRIAHEHLGNEFNRFYHRGGYTGAEDEKRAESKYTQFGRGLIPTNYFIRTKNPRAKNKHDKRECWKIVQNQEDQTRRGVIVFTGQPSEQKQLEFIFFSTENQQKLIVNDKVIGNFKFAYFDHDKSQQSEDWKWRKNQLENERKSIPVFFQVDQFKAVKHLGLSYLYKLPYNNSVKDSVANTSKSHLEEKLDLSEAIFGMTSKETFLKGRVHVGPALSENAQQDPVTRELVLSSPKASYYPMYILQNIYGTYNTFMDGGVEIAGWKRYPVRAENYILPEHEREIDATQKKVSSSFKRLESGAVFTTKIRYHNLRKEELGALISAVTFHGTAHDDSYHSLGIAKAYGYGKCSVRITNLSKKNQQELLANFECYMNANLSGDWVGSDQMKELKSLITEKAQHAPPELNYMVLDKFREAKAGNERLQKYSTLSSRNLEFPSYCDPDQVNSIREQIAAESQKWGQVKEATSAIDQNFGTVEEEFKELFEAKKQAFLAELKDRRDAQQQVELKAEAVRLKIEADKKAAREAAEREKKRAAKAAAGEVLKEAGFDFSSVDLSGRDPFNDSLKKLMGVYIEKIHVGSYDKLKKEIPVLLPVEEHPDLKIKLKECFAKLNTKQQKKWKDKNSAYQKKTAEWVGDEKAAEWWNSDLFT